MSDALALDNDPGTFGVEVFTGVECRDGWVGGDNTPELERGVSPVATRGVVERSEDPLEARLRSFLCFGQLCPLLRCGVV